MELPEIAKMEQEERNYWWHIGRREVLQKVLGKYLPPNNNLDILDIGCGTGINYLWLKEWGKVIGADVSTDALEYCRFKRAYDSLIQIDGTSIPTNTQFDLITAFDVLEHIEDDISALSSWHQALKPNGYVFITVPAYQWLFSAHDKALQHYRRYSAKELKQKFAQAGFDTKFISPFFWFTFPMVVLVRLLTKKSKPKTSYVETPGMLGKFLINLSKSEANFLSHGDPLPWGSSLLAIATKK